MNSISLSFFTMATSLTSLGYHLVHNAKVLELTGEGLKSQSFMLSAFLSGLALGGFYYEYLKKNKDISSLKLLLYSELLVTVIGSLGLAILSLSTSSLLAFGDLRLAAPLSIPPNFILSIGIPLQLLLGLASGVQLPCLLSLHSKEENSLLFLNYFGALLAGPIINIFLGRSIGYEYQLQLFLLLNFCNLIILLTALKKLTYFPLTLVPMILFAFLLIKQPKIDLLEKSLYFYGHKIKKINQVGHLIDVSKKYGKIESSISPYQSIDIVTEPAEAGNLFDGNLTLYLNKKPQFSLYSQKVYHESMVEGSFNLAKKIPQKVLILGAGDGILLDRILEYKEVQKVTMVELDETVINISSRHYALSNLNNRVYDRKDPRAVVIIDDAINYLRRASKTYDAIFLDFPFPYSQELLKIFSFEFYRLVKERLTPSGFVIMDFPAFEDENKKSYISQLVLGSFKKAGFENFHIFGPSTPFIFGSLEKTPLDFDYPSLPKDLSLGTLKNLIGINHQYENQSSSFLSMFMTGGAR